MVPKRKSDRDIRNGSKIGAENGAENVSEMMSFGRPKTITNVKLSSNSFFPNRSLLLRVLMEAQRKEKKGKETESVPGQGGARPRPQR